jgi:uncharacterized protein (DUF983 family)
MSVSPLRAGLRLRCPACGEGRLYSSYLKLAPRCAACGADFAVADAGDGPTVFVILAVGAIATALLFILQFGVGLPDWLALTITLLFATGLSLALLPPFKALMFALQWRHKASQVRNEDVEAR